MRVHKKFFVVFTLLVFNNFECCDNMSLLEFVFGPRLKSAKTGKYLAPSAAEALVQSFRYPVETHRVVTEDKYVLTVHRIPRGRKHKLRDKLREGHRPVVVLHHGFLSASDTWLFRGPKQDLPYILADAGYDVWLCNARGNVYSRKHLVWDPNSDVEFWKYSFHEIGVYDLSATIDYILKTTNQKSVYFIGYSMGSAAGLVLCSMRPEYNKKIRLFLALAPTVMVRHQLSPVLDFLISTIPITEQAVYSENIYELLPRRQYISRIGDLLCQDNVPTQRLCLSAMFLLVGEDYKQFNSTMLPTALKYFPSGISSELVLHYYQMYSTGTFRQLDYGIWNMAKYGQNVPPDYNLTKVTVPVSLYFGNGDLLVTREDIEALTRKLPNVVQVFQVPFPKFNHMDFMWAHEGKKLLYNHMITLMNKFK